jgi:hypothetical protein
MLRGISSIGMFGHAKPCVINAFDTNYLLSAHDVMAIILHLARSMETELTRTDFQPLRLRPHRAPRLWQMDVDPMVNVVTPVEAVALVAVCLICVVHAAAWTTSFRHAHHVMPHF